MEEDSWPWTPVCGLLAPGCGVLAVDSWLWTPGCGLLAVDSWLWTPGCGLLAVDSWLPRRHSGGTQEAARKHPGDTQEAPRRQPGHPGLQRGLGHKN